MGVSLSTIRFKATPRCSRARAETAKFLTQTPGWNSSGWCPVTIQGAWRSGSVGSLQSEPLQIGPRGREGLLTGEGPEPAGASALEVVVPGVETRAVGREQVARLAQGRHGQDPAIAAGGPEAMRFHQAQPSTTFKPLRSIAARKTVR